MKDEAQVIKEAEDALSLMNYKKSNPSVIRKEYQDIMNDIREEYENKNIFGVVSLCEDLLDDMEDASFEEETIVSKFVSDIMMNIETIAENTNVYPSMIPYFTPSQMLEIGVFDKDPNGNCYKVESSMDHAGWFNHYLMTGNPGEDWYKEVSEAYLECYRNPSNENKQNLLELGWNPEVEFNIEAIQNRRAYVVENMKSSYISTVIDLTESRISNYYTDSICESYIVSKDDINLNFNSWVSGSKNILYITGLSGSGKSTLSKTLAKEYNAKIIEFDKFTVGLVKGKDALDKRSTNPFILEYISGHSLPKLSWDDQDTPRFNDEHKKFLAWLENKLSESENADKKFILEGIQIFNNIDANHFKSKSLIIVGTSVLESWMRRNKRTFSNCNNTKDKLINFIFNLKMFPSFAEYEKSLQNFRNTVNESAIEDRQKMISIIEKGLSDIGIKSGINNSDKDWGRDVFLSGKSRSLFVCIEKDKDKQKEILTINKSLSRLGGRLHLDNYNSIFLRAKKMKLVNESTIQESISSTVNNDFKNKEKLLLSKFKKVSINKNQKLNGLEKHLRYDNCSGYVYYDKDDIVAIINVETKSDDSKWIQALEITTNYQGHGISKQLLNVAVHELHATSLSVNKRNEVAIKIYKEYGFNTYHETDTMLFMQYKTNTSIQEGLKSENSIVKELNETIKSKINKSYKDYFISITNLSSGGFISKEETEVKLFGFNTLPLEPASIYDPANKNRYKVLYSIKLNFLFTKDKLDKDLKDYASSRKYKSLFKSNLNESTMQEDSNDDHFVSSKYIRDILFDQAENDNRSTDFTLRDIESDDGGYTIADCKVIDRLTQNIIDIVQNRIDNSIFNKYFIKPKSAGESGWILYVYPKNEIVEDLKDLQDKVFNNFDWYKK